MRIKREIWTGFLGALVSGAACTSAPAPHEDGKGLSVAAFEMKDQHGKVHKYEGKGGKPAVFLVAGRDGVQSNIRWDGWISSRYREKVDLYRVLDLTGVPRLFESIVVQRTRENTGPDGPPVLLDWDCRFASLMALSEKESTVILTDREGKVRLALRGVPEGEAVAKVARTLDPLVGGPP